MQSCIQVSWLQFYLITQTKQQLSTLHFNQSVINAIRKEHKTAFTVGEVEVKQEGWYQLPISRLSHLIYIDFTGHLLLKAVAFSLVLIQWVFHTFLSDECAGAFRYANRDRKYFEICLRSWILNLWNLLNVVMSSDYERNFI